MKKYVLVGMITLGMVYSCATNPVTGKKILSLNPNNQLFPVAFQQYDTFLKENKVITGTADAKKVEAIGFRIKAAAEKYLAYLGQSQYLTDYRWEYKLIENKEVNAWCMPGGKIVVYSGILPVTKDDAGLATVMGHEVSHALADHGAQRMTAGQAQQVLGQVISVAVSGKSEKTQQIIGQAYGLGSQFGGMLPFSRSHETEADKIGLVLMTIAGYNPETSIAFWQRMSAQSNGQAPPEFMSTHPSDATRIANLQAYIPEAKAIAAKVGVIK
ncbi:M48 family metallopeptidase [Flavobacterium sp. FPG59]|jgi:predicted Zn-dependent protease|uniref:M48 family metallopeptidase n=1 Tax=Flavobacterium sp. FPG59 TaxID=1929267 RepID=UPI000A386EC1|nr:M48 family metallopeptidase [Flavobacterium sp. FPG59]OUD36670.1 peptidase M48 [Flavobacterium sp. FPG59]